MIDVEKYISEGIVESYALGIANEQETREFEKLLPLYPELRKALFNFENMLEKNAVANAVSPPAGAWSGIQRGIPRERLHSNGGSRANGNKDHFIPVTPAPSNQIRVHKFWRYAFITVFILSKIFLCLAIYYYMLYKNELKQNEQLLHGLHQEKRVK